MDPESATQDVPFTFHWLKAKELAESVASVRAILKALNIWIPRTPNGDGSGESVSGKVGRDQNQRPRTGVSALHNKSRLRAADRSVRATQASKIRTRLPRYL